MGQQQLGYVTLGDSFSLSLAMFQRRILRMPRWTKSRIARFGNKIHTRLRQHLDELGFIEDPDGRLRPPDSSKEGLRAIHRLHRAERLSEEASFIKDAVPRLLQYFAESKEIVPARISPRIQIVEPGTMESDLFRLASLTWSVPVSQGYGRRMRFLVWDGSNGKLMGLIALGDPVFNLRVRDQRIGWTTSGREKRLVCVMDAYVLGALPPYSYLLGGKLVACLTRSREIRDCFSRKYGQRKSIIANRKKHAALGLITTSSSLGRSSVYNRLKLDGVSYFDSIGYTTGWGHFHVPAQLFAEMRKYMRLKRHRYAKGNRFGDGPNWKLRLIRAALDDLGYESDLLRHGIMREVFASNLATNTDRVLRGEVGHFQYRGLLSVQEIGHLARERWLIPRALRRPEFRFWARENILELLDYDSNNKASQLDKQRQLSATA
jgi:hypothetical protein